VRTKNTGEPVILAMYCSNGVGLQLVVLVHVLGLICRDSMFKARNADDFEGEMGKDSKVEEQDRQNGY